MVAGLQGQAGAQAYRRSVPGLSVGCTCLAARALAARGAPALLEEWWPRRAHQQGRARPSSLHAAEARELAPQPERQASCLRVQAAPGFLAGRCLAGGAAHVWGIQQLPGGARIGGAARLGCHSSAGPPLQQLRGGLLGQGLPLRAAGGREGLVSARGVDGVPAVGLFETGPALQAPGVCPLAARPHRGSRHAAGPAALQHERPRGDVLCCARDDGHRRPASGALQQADVLGGLQGSHWQARVGAAKGHMRGMRLALGYQSPCWPPPIQDGWAGSGIGCSALGVRPTCQPSMTGMRQSMRTREKVAGPLRL